MEALSKYELFDYFELWLYYSTVPTWKTIVKIKINKYDANAWNEYASGHPNLHSLELVLKMFLHVRSGLLLIFIRAQLPADMFRLD